MDIIDKIIYELFSTRWSGNLRERTINNMRKQLFKTLRDQCNGYWSGHTAYYIAVDGGFLIDSKRIRDDNSGRCRPKKLTLLGKMFMYGGV
jgi:hypothetical protein